MRTIAEDAELSISERVGLSGAAVVCASRIFIGPRTLVGSGAVIIDNDFHDRLPSGEWGNDGKRTAKPIRIGSDVFIGARAMILKGVSIGDRAVVGAGSVVTRDVPAGALAVGNPARIIQT
jgi:acetyltransferase-like isoleucine patch superfamily enzyme